MNPFSTSLGRQAYAIKDIYREYRKCVRRAEDELFVSEAEDFFIKNAMSMQAHASRAHQNLILAGLKALPEELASWADGVLDEKNAFLSEDSMLKSLSDADEMQFIGIRKLRFAPDALLVKAAEKFDRAAKTVSDIQKSRLSAQRWARSDAALPPESEQPEFFEHAFRIISEMDDAVKKEMLEKRLASMGRTQDDVVYLALERQANAVLTQKTALSAAQTAMNIDWAEAFSKISFTEKQLLKDPEGVYPNMDGASKEEIRKSVQEIAEKARVSERSVVSAALEIAENHMVNGVCEAFYTDKGRTLVLAQLNAENAPIRRLVPDQSGKRLLLSQAALFLLFSVGAFAVLPLPAFLAALPAIYVFSQQVRNALIRRMVPARPLLKLKMETVPEAARTLVVIPALIPDAARGEELMFELETYGACQRDKNIDYLLLGDFRDGARAVEETDGEILDAVNRRKREMNERAGRSKYFYLHRKRRFSERQGAYMGRERKRGALEDLNLLLLGLDNRFDAEGADAELLQNKYAYLITLDADTRLIPETVRRLIGAMHHPLNRAYAVIQPRMEISPEKLQNRFQARFVGAAGSDTYNVCSQDPYQDLTGNGVFSGKGILNIRLFLSRTFGAFEENTVLSHDMIEGVLSGAGYAGDIALYEGFPKTPAAYIKRAERWTRGDWQLLYYAFGRIRLTLLDRFKIFDNLARSMADASLLLMMILSVWTGSFWTLALAFWMLVYPSLSLRREQYDPAVIRLLLLPSMAFATISAAARAVYRVFVSKRHMLDWVTAADADNLKEKSNAEGVICAILLLPVLNHLPFLPAALVLAVAFIFGKQILSSMTREEAEEKFSLKRISCLTELARDIWKYFEKCVPLGTGALPPDNLQLDPPRGYAQRTSPTNIAMYLASVVGAAELGLIDKSEAHARLREIAGTLRKLPKHRGLLYNWYDTKTLSPLRPRFVSSVDCGNLLASYVLARNYLRTAEPALAQSYQGLIEESQIEYLYDEKKKLFRIGYDAENDAFSAAHYDLLASEARILSYVSMCERGIGMEHWNRLSRPCAFFGKNCALLSWSGTMFEYMMPLIFMPSAQGTLLSQTSEAVARLQEQNAVGGLWGISESGYMSFDASLNYQYRAFGINELSLSGSLSGKVISPYSSILALSVLADKSYENMERMSASGLRGEFGFYEAIDCTKNDRQGEIVFSFMTHHQGMAFLSLANALTDNRIQKIFMDCPREQAYLPALNEKPFARPRLFRHGGGKCVFDSEGCAAGSEKGPRAEKLYIRNAPLKRADEHMLFSGGVLCCFDTFEGSFYRKDGVYLNEWRQSPYGRRESLLPEMWENGEKAGLAKVSFDAGACVYEYKTQNAFLETAACIDSESGALLLRVKAKNETPKAIAVSIEQAFRVSLAGEDQMLSHPLFSDLFVEKSRDGNINIFTRTPRSEQERPCLLVHAVYGMKAEPTDEANTVELRSSLRGTIALSGFESKSVFFSVGIFDSLPKKGEITEREFRKKAFYHSVQAATLLSSIGLNRSEYVTFEAAAFLAVNALSAEGREKFSERALWPVGLSAVQPILLMRMNCPKQMPVLKSLIKARRYYQLAGLRVPLVVVYINEAEYFTPLKDAIEGAVSASHLSGLKNREGGVYLLKADELTDAMQEHLNALSILTADRRIEPPHKREKERLQRRFSGIGSVDLALADMRRTNFNAFGGFNSETGAYVIDVLPQRRPPASWTNLLANPEFGAMASDKGIGCIWYQNSRLTRITPFSNNVDDDSETVRIYAGTERCFLPLMPSAQPGGAYRVAHGYGKTVYECAFDGIRFTTSWFADACRPCLCAVIEIKNLLNEKRRVKLTSDIRFLMGADERDARLTRITQAENVVYASGRAGFTAFARFDTPMLNAWQMPKTELEIPESGEARACFLLGAGEDEAAARALAASFEPFSARKETEQYWQNHLRTIAGFSGNNVRDMMLNGWAKYQTLVSRLYARSGPYQPGGAFGFRDQLQDLLSVLYIDPPYVRRHILLCAARQFEAGDAMHWWHPDYRGVRTRISDDVLFMAYITAKYVRQTGDASILEEKVPYLTNEPIPEGKEDIYFEAKPTAYTETLYAHILKAFRKAGAAGAHGLLLMGSGDWNDGMNAVGRDGKGESVWLSEFYIVCARLFLPYACKEDAEYLKSMCARLTERLENAAWDGEWYRRAFNDFGEQLGSGKNRECRIDLISQAWACFAGLREDRCRKALLSAEKLLVDRKVGIIRLLTPPFTGMERNPGYIAAYPPGVRENGGQYTHAACWYVSALARWGDAKRAWEAFDMLLPVNRTDTEAKAGLYRGEPYVIAADVWGGSGREGVCGWTWYTGAAAWAVRVFIEDLLGVEITGESVSMRALLPPEAEEVSVSIRRGASQYRLVAAREAAGTVREAPLTDDGKAHEYRFCAREERALED